MIPSFEKVLPSLYLFFLVAWFMMDVKIWCYREGTTHKVLLGPVTHALDYQLSITTKF